MPRTRFAAAASGALALMACSAGDAGRPWPPEHMTAAERLRYAESRLREDQAAGYGPLGLGNDWRDIAVAALAVLDLDRAESAAHEALTWYAQHPPPPDPDSLRIPVVELLAGISVVRGACHDAIALLAQTLEGLDAAQPRLVLDLQARLAKMYAAGGLFDLAVTTYQPVLDSRDQSVRLNSAAPASPSSHALVAEWLFAAERFEESEEQARIALTAARAMDEADHRRWPAYQAGHAEALLALGRLDEADAELGEAASLVEAAEAVDLFAAEMVFTRLAELRGQQGRFEEAQRAIEKARAALEAWPEPEFPYQEVQQRIHHQMWEASILHTESHLRLLEGKPAEAAALSGQTLSLLEGLLGTENPNLTDVLELRQSALSDLGDGAAAERVAARLEAARARRAGTDVVCLPAWALPAPRG